MSTQSDLLEAMRRFYAGDGTQRARVIQLQEQLSREKSEQAAQEAAAKKRAQIREIAVRQHDGSTLVWKVVPGRATHE